MGVTVYVLMLDDGNVCCPSSDVVGVFSTKDLAEAHRETMISSVLRRDESDFGIIMWTVDRP